MVYLMITECAPYALASDDLAEMQRAACAPEGSALLMSWLARRLGGLVVLVSGGRVRWRTGGGDVPAGLAGAVAQASGGVDGVAAVPVPGWDARLMRLGGCAVVAARRHRRDAWAAGDEALLRAAGGLLRLRLAEEEAARAREGVFRLLMEGQSGPARRLAEVSGVAMAAVISVVLVQCPPARREETARAAEAAAPGLWIRCPVFGDQVIGVISARSGRTDTETVEAVRRACPGLLTAAGGAVRLADAAAGYEQAWTAHVLARRSRNMEGPARGNALAGLAAALETDGAAWARDRLAPILEDGSRTAAARARRDERIATLTAWLAYGTDGAAGALHLHRNALTGTGGRIPRISALLGEDLGPPGTRAELSLALRLHDPGPGPGSGDGGTPPSLGGLLAGEPARAWAAGLLAPLADAGLLEPVRAWTLADGNRTAAARKLGITAPVLRRRLVRAETMLRMVLVSGGGKAAGLTARYALYLAFRTTGN
jgi:hypothetical protein